MANRSHDMSCDENSNQEKQFSIERAKQGRAFCKKCKRKCQEGDLRIAKLTPNPLRPGKIKTWYHVECIFEVFLKQRPSTKRIEYRHDVEGWESLSENAQLDILAKIQECNDTFEAMQRSLKKSKSRRKSQTVELLDNEDSMSVSSMSADALIKPGPLTDNSFREFRTVVAKVSNAKASQEKIHIFRSIFHKGSDGISFKGSLLLWCKLLLPNLDKRPFQIDKEQLIKICSRCFGISVETIKEDLETNELGQSIKNCFKRSKKAKPAHLSSLTISDVDEFLDVLCNLTEEEDCFKHFNALVERCTSNDLKVIIRLICRDLLMKAGAKHVLEAVDPRAYRRFKLFHDVKAAIRAYSEESQIGQFPKRRKSASFDKTLIPKKIKIEDVKEFEKTTSFDRSLSAKKIKTEDDKSFEKTNLKTIPSEDCENSKEHVPFPNYFENVKLYLEEGVWEKYENWVRHFSACGGRVLKSNENEEATHVLHLKDTIAQPTIKCPSSCRHVIIEWIKDTLKKESVQEIRPYLVRWKPSLMKM